MFVKPADSLTGTFLTVLGVFSGLGGSILTVLSSSYQTREVFIDAEINRYGFPLPWSSKVLGSAVSTFDGLLQQARAPPRIDLVAFVLDFAFYTVAVIVLVLAVTGLVWAASSAARRLTRPNGSCNFSTVKN